VRRSMGLGFPHGCGNLTYGTESAFLPGNLGGVVNNHAVVQTEPATRRSTPLSIYRRVARP
jgi:hypothetical protein